MPLLIDTGLWIAFMRSSSPRHLKQAIAPYIIDPDACLAEPIAFEVLRRASSRELPPITRQFATYPMLTTPADLWVAATKLGQQCQTHGISAGSVDLLIAAIALTHDATLITFDGDFEHIAKICALKIKRLARPDLQ